MISNFQSSKNLCYTETMAVLQYCDNIKWKLSNTMALNAYHKNFGIYSTP